MENASQQKELAILKQLCDGHFQHDNVCRVLDVSISKAPVTTSSGILLL